ncbi:GvpL/GvpF family gas vesicle protein [Falsiroseomonas sp. E2-1-a20]|uniref:GvpL/GvpF family gas vesicle protein n=1 Tax=Falsiroseomonas sp. E2-1-a20 TaxID=3239300 RepID=UPI003F3EC2CB
MTEALYAYAVAPTGSLPDRLDIDGILPGAMVLALDEAGLTALASTVPREAFEAGPGCRMEDADWLADRAAAHHGVVAALPGTVLPLAFGAVFSGEAPLRDWLRQCAPRLSSALAAVSGCTEWAVTLEEDAVRHGIWLREADPALARLASQADRASPGTAFLLARRLDKALAASRQARLQDTAQSLGRLLLAEARHLAPSRPRNGAVAGWSALLGQAAQHRLRTALEAEALALSGTGLSLNLSGPWPPYAFAREAMSDA